ncbi:hypothetical protein K227x_02660 [Rubripirellula lacrimiformis]|uniref:Tetratricopeptide repeat protein n=2 Tax=Rubripirellula lacrimiformis TaxID=1930273 RepID=A0A517N434_9BACT|nr:hypothetical protein K227x_02660 [Rubripirellula lacrimiformis]
MAELWWRGRLSALPLAIGFALALNAVLVTGYIYPEWMSGGLVSMAFWIGVVAWGFTVVRSVRELPSIVAPRSVTDEPDRFVEAHQAFLQANYSEAETLLNQVLAIETRDPPALLLLSGVYRHTGRLESAEMLLDEIRRLEVSDRWFLEIRAEAKRLAAAMEASNASETEPETGSENETKAETESSAETATPSPADLTEPVRRAA